MNFIDGLVSEQSALNAFRATSKMRSAAESVLSIWTAGDHVEPSDGAKIDFLAKKFPFKGRAYTWSAKADKWLGWTRKPQRHSVVVGTVEGLDVAALARWAKQVGLDEEHPYLKSELGRLIKEGDIASTKPGVNVKPYGKAGERAMAKLAKKLAKKSAKKAVKSKAGAQKPLKGKTVLFTGKLKTGLTRTEAEKCVRKAGGKPVHSVSKDLDILVVGAAGSPLFKKDNKRAKVERLNQDGAGIRSMSEKAFLKLCGAE